MKWLLILCLCFVCVGNFSVGWGETPKEFIKGKDGYHYGKPDFTYTEERWDSYSNYLKIKSLEARIEKLEEKDISYFINKDREGGLCVCGYIIYVTPTNNMCPYCGWLWIVTEDGGMKDPTMIEERDNEGNYMWNGNKYSSKCIRIK
ncbi:hypothetical protein LCGC14_3038210 [marine sediment metagenome]|uniref:Uncharacterized protein n=1 Tax=marine sediment metagenome TaxID=412755 RepID=A0A0F8ZGB9_9ZZZZ